MNHLRTVRLRRTLTTVVLVTAAAVLLLTVAPAVTDAAQPPVGVRATGDPLADSTGLGGRDLARGRVVDASGAPAAGVGVVLYAWPSNAVADHLVAGDRVRLTAVARSRTTAAGRYVLRVPELGSLLPFAGPDRAVNLEVVASGAGGTVAVHAFSRDLVTNGAVSAVARPPRLVAAGAGGRAATGDAPPLRAHLTLEPGGPGLPAARVRAATSLSCSASLTRRYKPRWGLVGQHYSRTGGVRSAFVYTSGAESQLGVGVSASGKYGTFHAGGTNSKSSSGSITFPPVRGAQSAYRLTKFAYGKYLVLCFGLMGTVTKHYEVRATTWAGGSQTRYPGPIRARHCVPFEAGSTFAKRDTRAVRWTNGMDVSAAIGIDLSLRTGYSQEALVRFHFVHAHRLCGSGDYPGGRPYQLEVRR